MAPIGVTCGGFGEMSKYIKFDFDAAVQLHEDCPATLATSAPQQGESSKSSVSSTPVPSLSPYAMPVNEVQSRAETTSGSLHRSDREPATPATAATQAEQSSVSSRSSDTA